MRVVPISPNSVYKNSLTKNNQNETAPIKPNAQSMPNFKANVNVDWKSFSYAYAHNYEALTKMIKKLIPDFKKKGSNFLNIDLSYLPLGKETIAITTSFERSKNAANHVADLLTDEKSLYKLIKQQLYFGAETSHHCGFEMPECEAVKNVFLHHKTELDANKQYIDELRKGTDKVLDAISEKWECRVERPSKKFWQDYPIEKFEKQLRLFASDEETHAFDVMHHLWTPPPPPYIYVPADVRLARDFGNICV